MLNSDCRKCLCSSEENFIVFFFGGGGRKVFFCSYWKQENVNNFSARDWFFRWNGWQHGGAWHHGWMALVKNCYWKVWKKLQQKNIFFGVVYFQIWKLTLYLLTFPAYAGIWPQCIPVMSFIICGFYFCLTAPKYLKFISNKFTICVYLQGVLSAFWSITSF